MLKKIKSIDNISTFFSGMVKAFDFTNSQRVFNRKRIDTTLKLYSEEKSDMERIADDWRVIGNDMHIAMINYNNSKCQNDLFLYQKLK